MQRRGKYSKRHGLSDTPEHHAWRNMRRRCLSPSDKEYKNYGGRGISICERWGDFNLFLEDMGQRPSPLHSLDRLNNEGDYDPANCRWATKSEQSANRRISRFLTFNGQTMTMAAWGRYLGLGPRGGNMIRLRLNKGWTVERTLTTPRLGKDGRPKS